jgi:photosystem II stability/assembly factor-like uncharacterized protein
MLHQTFRVCAVSLGAAILLAPSPVAQQRPALPLDNITWRHIGPAAFGGRIDDIEAVAGNPSIIFVGAASGGVFKSVNNGVTWKPVFDKDGTSLSIGDIAIAPSDPNIVWAGTGEANNRQSSSWGDGAFKSVDGGETWTQMGLRDTHHVGRIVIHPTNPNVVFVAALGHLWGPNEERGLYRTNDGGRTWDRVLKIDSDTGVVDVAIDGDGRTLFAAAYQRRRRGWGFGGGGPGSGLYRSLDGGDTWQKLGGGLPEGTVGRIGVEISRSDPKIVYAVVEHKDGGVFRSEDRGTTWTKQNSLDQRPSYYSQIRIDPRNPNKVWQLASPLFVSIDAGKTWRSNDTGDKIHVDHHALWIDPNNPDHLMLGNDGGLYFSYDGSRTWDFIDNLAIGQYYDISVDGRDPYWIYGGTQDNGTWGIPVRTSSQLGITNSDVVNIAYGDGFYTIADPKDPRSIYANSQSGRTYFVDLETREEKGIRPVPQDPKEEYRFNWSTPMFISPHDSRVIYYGGNKLFRTSDRGQTWDVISPDLTRNQDWKKLPIMGPERSADTLSRDDGVSDFGTITTIAESPVKAGVLYVGTDDGLVQMTTDGGKNWQNITSKFKLPGPRWVSRVLGSRHGAGTAYVAFDGHQDDDFKPYIFRTTDNGSSWTSISGDIPNGMVVNALEEHPRNPNLLFAGTEFGLFITMNGGTNWTHVRGNLPRVPVDDIILNERTNDIVLGTHGRSIIVLDDACMLEHLTEKVLTSEAHLFPIKPAMQYYDARMLPVPGASEFSGPNPEYGALITYFLRSDPPKETTTTTSDSGNGAAGGSNGAAMNVARDSAGPKDATTVKITVLAPDGSVVRELQGPDRKGFNRVSWDLRYPLTFKPIEGDEGWFGPPKGTFVLPGEYSIKLSARGKELTEKVRVTVDPRARTTPEALETRFKASQAAADLQRAFTESADVVQAIVKELDAVNASIKSRESVPPDVTAAVKEFSKKLDDLKERFKGGWGGPRFRIFDLAGQLQASTSAPTDAQLRSLDQLSTLLTTNVGELNTFTSREVPALQEKLRAAGVATALLKQVAPPKKM